MSGQPHGGDSGVYIPSEKTYEEVRRIADGQIRLEAKVDAVHGVLTEIRQSHTDHEARIRDLESRRLPHSVLNIAAAVGATVALIWQALGR